MGHLPAADRVLARVATRGGPSPSRYIHLERKKECCRLPPSRKRIHFEDWPVYCRLSPTGRRGGSTPTVFHVDLGPSQRRLHDQAELCICGLVHFALPSWPAYR